MIDFKYTYFFNKDLFDKFNSLYLKINFAFETNF